MAGPYYSCSMIKKLIRRILGGADPGAAVRPKTFGPQEHGIDPDDVSPNAVRVTQALQTAGYKAFIVGGAVRDLVLGLGSSVLPGVAMARYDWLYGHDVTQATGAVSPHGPRR